jgi:hypothetical protein
MGNGCFPFPGIYFYPSVDPVMGPRNMLAYIFHSLFIILTVRRYENA